MIYDQEDKVVQERFESLLSRYQAGIEESIKISDFVFDCVNLLHYKCHKLILITKRDGSYKGCPDWIKNKKITANPEYYDNTRLQYAAKVTINHKEIRKNSNRMSGIKSKEKDKPLIRERRLENASKNNPTIVINVLYVKKNEYISCLHFKAQLKP